MKNFKKFVLLGVVGVIGLIGCAKNKIDDDIIVVGATSVPHAEILNEIKEYISENGYTLKIKEFSDYQQLNPALQDGSLDANFFQHAPFLNNYNEEKGTNLVGVFNVHFEPLSLYRGSSKSATVSGTIAIPNDNSNGARALLLLAANNIIELDESKGLNVSVTDITDKKGITIKEIEAAILPTIIDDASIDFAVINGNYALAAKIAKSRILFTEESESVAAAHYANLIAVKSGNEDAPAIKLLIEALNRDEVRDFIIEKYENSVVPVF